MPKIVPGWWPKHIILLALACVNAVTRADQPPEILTASSPQTYTVNGVGGQESGITVSASICDLAGNTFMTGFFSGTATFGTNVLTGSGGYGADDVYLVKYDAAGNVLWARRAGGTAKETGRVIQLDGAGGVYIAGTTASSPSAFGTNLLYVAFQTLYLARYDGEGNCLWAKKAGSWQLPGLGFVSATMTVNGLALDPAGNPVVGGNYTGNPKFGGAITNVSFPYVLAGGIILSNRSQTAGTADIFLAKYDSAGGLLWATNHGGTNAEYASSVAVDHAGAIYVGGGFTQNTIVGDQFYTNIDAGLLLAKFSSLGEPVWSSSLSDATNSNRGYGWSVVVDGADRVAFGFEAKTEQPFRFAGVAITNKLSGPGFTPVYMGLLAQFNSAGTLQWLKRTPFNGYGNGFPANASTLAVDAGNNLYFGSASVRMESESNFGLVSSAGLGILKFSANGVGLWTNYVPQGALSPFQPPVLSFDGTGLLHGTTTIKGDKPALLTVGWINYYPFAAFGYNQCLFTMASNFVAVAPQFFVQPTNMVYQPPKGLTNSAQARAWPAPRYYWFMTNTRLASQTNFFLGLAPTDFTNQASYFVVASNAYAMATSSVVTAQAKLAFAPLPPTNINVLTGTILAIPSGATGTSAIDYQWRLNGTNLVGATSSTLALPGIGTNQSGSYTLVISNASAVLTSAPPTLVNVVLPGFVDPSLTNDPSYFGTTALDLLRWPDGGYYGAQSTYIFHRKASGALDTNGPWAGTTGAGVQTFAPESDTQFMVGGTFFGGVARMNTNGTIDPSFNPGTGPSNTIEGVSFRRINSILRLPNGQYLVAGRFNVFNGIAATNLVRLNTNGAVDLTFPRYSILYSSSPIQGPGEILRLARQGDGKILVGGEFGIFNSLSVSNLVRLNADGTGDASFSASDTLKAPPYGRVHAILPLADGKILVGGAWGNGTNAGVARLLSNGALDVTFHGAASTAPAHALALVNNKLIAGGQNFVKRLSYDGDLDVTFKSASTFYWDGTQTEVIIPEPSGNVMVGGSGYGMRRLWLEPTPVVVPSFSSGAGVALVNGQFQLSACGGVDGQSIVVQASTDLVNWINVSTNMVVGGCVSYTGPAALTLPQQYFRLTVLP